MNLPAAFATPLRRFALAGLRHSLASRPTPGEIDLYRFPEGDPGLFGPGSLVWQVHGDLPVMLVGGFSALMLQSLHPLAMAGVNDHSRFREDPIGRLQRTAHYVAGTSFGPMPLVEELIAQVRRAHRHVHGIAPDGRPYSADDPELVTWVHTTEMWSILRSHQRYSLRPLLAAEKDRYLDEVAVLGELLGGRDIPRSVAEVRRYFADLRPELAATAEATSAVEFLRRPLSGGLRDVAAHRLVSEAAVDLLPGWARRLLGLRAGPFPRGGSLPLPGPIATRAAAASLAVLVRWAIGPSLVRSAAEERVQGRAA